MANGINRLSSAQGLKMAEENRFASEAAQDIEAKLKQKKTIKHAKQSLQADFSDGVIDDYGAMKSNYNDAIKANKDIDGKWKGHSTQEEYKFTYVNGKFDTKGDSDAAKRNKQTVENLLTAYDDAIADLESREKIDNMKIQELMNTYSMAEQTAAGLQKKLYDADSAPINK